MISAFDFESVRIAERTLLRIRFRSTARGTAREEMEIMGAANRLPRGKGWMRTSSDSLFTVTAARAGDAPCVVDGEAPRGPSGFVNAPRNRAFSFASGD